MKWNPNEQNTIFVSGIYTNRSYHDPALILHTMTENLWSMMAALIHFCWLPK